MGTSLSAGQFVGKIRAAEKALAGAPKKALEEIGDDMVAAFDAAVDADIGGNTFSGWPNAPLVAKAKLQGADSLVFAPVGKSKGPTRVAESGRHPGMFGPMQGPALKGFTKKGKARKSSARKWNGSTEGKETWSDATEAIAKVLPKKLSKGIVDAMRKVF